MKLSRLALALATCGACAALPAAAQDPYDSNSNDYRYQQSDRDAQDWRDRDAQDWRDRDAYRDNRGEHRDDRVGRVLDVQPVAANQREECWNTRTNAYEEVRGPEKAKILSKDTAIGAIAGGIIGHQFNSGAVGTLGGAALGGLAGHAYEQHRDNEQAQQDDLDRSRCRTVASGDSRAYDVRYRYQGQEYVARMDHPPGDTLVPGRDIDQFGHPFQAADANAYSSR